MTCTFGNSQDCGDCYRILFRVSIPGHSDEIVVYDAALASQQAIFGSQDSVSTSVDGCSTTLSYIQPNRVADGYIGSYHNTQWKAVTSLTNNFSKRKDSDQSITTRVQVLLSSIPQESIKTTIVQPLDIVSKIIALSNSQQIEGSYRARAKIDWPHAESLDGGDGTYFDRQYIINGGSEGELGRTSDNSTEITLNSEQVARNFTLITENQLGASENGTTSFQFPWHEPSIQLSSVATYTWRILVDITEPVTDLEIEDSRTMESIIFSDLAIIANGAGYGVITFTANLMDGQNYTLRMILQNIATTQEIKATMQATIQATIQATMQESQATLDENTLNSGTRSQALPQLLITAAIAALTVNQLMSVRTP